MPNAVIDPLSSVALPGAILTGDAPYLKNLAVLWAIDPAMAERIEALDIADDPAESLYPIQPTRSGGPTVSLAGANGRPVFLHSRYEPADEASKLIAGIETDKIAAFFVHGFGLGYHIEALFEKSGEETPIYIFEPDLRLIRTALWHRDLAKLLESKRLHFITTADKSEILNRLTPQIALLSLGIGSVDHPASLQVQPAFHKHLKQQLDEFSSFARTSLNTVLLNSTKTAQNIARNLAWYAASPCVSRLKNRFSKRPAVIVSAGPSLKKNQHLLPAVQDKAVIIAVQTTLQPLVQMGLEPHFVTSLDYHDISTRFFENLPKDRKLRTELVAEPKATNKIFELLDGNVSLLGNKFADSLLREMKLSKDGLPAGATVAHLSFYLAEYLGCDPIIFLGQDLGFSDGLFYSAGTSYEDVWRPELGRFCSVEMKQWDQIVRERFLLRRIPDFQGNAMYTEERMFTYLQQFERDFANTDRQVIDATEGGAAKRGSTPMPFAAAIDTYCTQPFDVDLSDHPGSTFTRSGDVAASLRKRRHEANVVEQISAETLPLLEEIRDHTEDQSRVNRAIARLDALRARMNELGPTYDLVTELTQRSQLDRFEADRRIRAARLDPVEKQKRQVTRDIANVRGVLDAAKRFQELMGEVIESLTGPKIAAA
jgi:hypothetical protein